MLYRLKLFFSKEKVNAFLIHLGISLIIFLVMLYFILVYWYPQPLFGTDGGWQGVRILAVVDIILGPLLTLIVFNKTKPKLKQDLAIIAFIQFSALVSGSWIVYQEHPALVVFVEDSLWPVTASQLTEQGFSVSSVEQYRNTRLPMAFVKLPGNFDELYDLRAESLRSGRPLSLYVELYQTLDNNKKQAMRVLSINMEEYVKNKPEDKLKYQHFLQKYKLQKNKLDQEKLIYIPLYSRYKIVIAVLDRESFDFIDVLAIRPPEFKAPKWPAAGNQKTVGI